MSKQRREARIRRQQREAKKRQREEELERKRQRQREEERRIKAKNKAEEDEELRIAMLMNKEMRPLFEFTHFGPHVLSLNKEAQEIEKRRICYQWVENNSRRWKRTYDHDFAHIRPWENDPLSKLAFSVEHPFPGKDLFHEGTSYLTVLEWKSKVIINLRFMTSLSLKGQDS